MYVYVQLDEGKEEKEEGEDGEKKDEDAMEVESVKVSPPLSTYLGIYGMYVCIYVCMYVCMYVGGRSWRKESTSSTYQWTWILWQ